MNRADILVGVDAGTSVIKAVAFDFAGRQLGSFSVRNAYVSGDGGAATQSLETTWSDCAAAIRGLADRIDGLAARTAAIGVTAQGDGTWLVGKGDKPVAEAWLWLDARSAPTVVELEAGPLARARFEATGTGLNACQQGSQLAHMDRVSPHLLDAAEAAMHCKDWLYLKLTGARATDPSEASFTFGNFRTRAYDEVVIEALGLTHRRNLLPEIIDGVRVTHPLTREAASATGLKAGTPVSLGYVDMVMTALGAGVWAEREGVACSVIGSTGVHMFAVPVEKVRLNEDRTGYVMALPTPDLVVQMQTNMAAALNLDWILDVAADFAAETGRPISRAELVERVDGWLDAGRPGEIVYLPYISEAGERGPFANANARAGFAGLSVNHRFPDLVRALVEALGMATRDCYAAIGERPRELRISGGAARSRGLRAILAASVSAPVRVSSREEAGAAGAAMMAAQAIGVYPDMAACVAEWVTPLLGDPEPPEPGRVAVYDRLFAAYSAARRGLQPAWDHLAAARRERAFGSSA